MSSHSHLESLSVRTRQMDPHSTEGHRDKLPGKGLSKHCYSSIVLQCFSSLWLCSGEQRCVPNDDV